MKLIRALLKPLSFLPALCLMYMIFSFSSQDGNASSALSYKVSYKIVETGAKILGENLDPWQIDSIAQRFHGPVRKLAHMTEYFALAITVAFPLYVYGLRGILLMLAAGFICVAFACGDEYHQSFVAGRSPSKRDVCIDSFGVFWGIILVRIICWVGSKTIFRPFSNESIQKREAKKAARKQRKAHKKEKRGNSADPQSYQDAPNGYWNQMPYQDNPNGYPNQMPYQDNPNGYPNQMPYQGNPNGYQNQTPYQDNSNGYQNQMPYQGNPNGYQNQMPYQGNPNGYPTQMPYQGNPNGSSQPSYHGNQNGYSGAPYPNSYGCPPYPYQNPNMNDEDDEYVSDKLSEDMSFRKLMRDLKEQKQERRSESKNAAQASVRKGNGSK